MAQTKKDPTVSSDSTAAGESYPEGTHPALPASEVTHATAKLEYRDVGDDSKPDPTSVVQEQVLHGDEATA